MVQVRFQIYQLIDLIHCVRNQCCVKYSIKNQIQRCIKLERSIYTCNTFQDLTSETPGEVHF